jgi:hypothetical protein
VLGQVADGELLACCDELVRSKHNHVLTGSMTSVNKRRD